MAVFNSKEKYGSVSLLLHWALAIAVVALFGMGLWIADLQYGHPWYHRAPALHKAVGVTVVALMLLRFGWRLINPEPDAGGLKPWERRLSKLLHGAMYLLVFAMGVSGYLLSTVDGRGISVFGLFELPSLLQAKGLEQQAGKAHEIIAFILIGLAALHALAALKHHFIDRDRTLLRMLGR